MNVLSSANLSLRGCVNPSPRPPVRVSRNLLEGNMRFRAEEGLPAESVELHAYHPSLPTTLKVLSLPPRDG